MREYLKFYIDGKWVDPVELKTLDVVNPATEEVSGKIALGSAADVDRAVKAARKAFATWSTTSREERLEVLQRILERIPEARRRPRRGDHRRDGRAESARQWLPGGARGRPSEHGHRGAEEFQVRGAARRDADRERADRCLRHDHAVELAASTRSPSRCSRRSRPAAPWCSSLRKSRHFSAQIFAEILDAAGVPAGVFNLIQGKGSGRRRGDGQPSRYRHDLVHRLDARRRRNRQERRGHRQARVPGAGRQEPQHHSRRCGISRRTSPSGVAGMMGNSGQTCSAPSRMLVPKARMDEAIRIAREAASKVTVGDPERRFRDGPGGLEEPSSTRSRILSRRASTRAPRWSPAAPAGRKGSTRAIT